MKELINQIRFELSWVSKPVRCDGCKYLTEIRFSIWRCVAIRDHFSVVSEGALCVAVSCHRRLHELPGSMPQHKQSEQLSTHDQPGEGEGCPKCGASLDGSGCLGCSKCGFRECA